MLRRDVQIVEALRRRHDGVLAVEHVITRLQAREVRLDPILDDAQRVR